MSQPSGAEPPSLISYGLDDALTLLAALEDARDALSDTRHLTVVVAVEDQVRLLAVNSASTTQREVPMSSEPLRASAAARRLGIPTSDLLRLIHDRRIGYVMVNGIAHIPEAAIAEYEAQAAS